MKKLLMMSIFTLGSMVAFASNGEKNYSLENFSALTAENIFTQKAEEFFNPTATYRIEMRIFICGVGGIGIDWFETATGPNGTGCVDATQLETLKTTYETIYTMYHPDACNIIAYAYKIDDCI